MYGKALVAASTIALLSSQAYAQNAEPFTGAYGDLGFGYENNNVSINEDVLNIKDLGFDADGLFLDLGLGYRYQFQNNFVLGLEGRFDYSFADTKVGSEPLGLQTNLEKGRSFGVNGTIGYALSDRTLANVKVGYVNSKVTADPLDKDLGDASKNLDGLRLGGEVNYMLTSFMGVRAGMDYTFYNSLSNEKLGGIGFELDDATVAPGIDLNSWRVGTGIFVQF
ncbi:hypothetical protein CCR85_13870 [Rhodothalassium salexigens]|uniref:outer membrane protein n=1 Tax=Rhodothalassium salexigens TaxID=1086 RepID=UPI001911CBB2|nr:outer membrane beta-barrel protein [Rhodothalassium salexigens]MBK5912573.1 hypothetical protein [Rhodothalassium salexigens]MBK5919647.1 hypothetical protein [Rhodothalassium salexigens]